MMDLETVFASYLYIINIFFFSLFFSLWPQIPMNVTHWAFKSSITTIIQGSCQKIKHNKKKRKKQIKNPTGVKLGAIGMKTSS